MEALLEDHAAWREFRQAKGGDRTAGESFHARWTRYVSRYAEGRFCREETRELTSRFFERTWRLVDDSFRWQCPFGMYLRAVVVNLVRDAQSLAMALREREGSLGLAAAVQDDATLPDGRPGRPSPQEALVASDRAAKLGAAMARLSDVDRRVIEAMLVEGRDGTEVALELGMKRQAVYQRLHRAKARLRLLLGESWRPRARGVEASGACLEERSS